MRVGQLIKMERRKQNIKQEILARGICSPSHLSKIESDATMPGDKVQQLLLQRLNITLEEDYVSPSPKEFTQFSERFQQLLNQRDRLAADLLYKEIHLFLEEYPLFEHKFSLLLMEIRLMFMISKDLATIKTKISILVTIQDDMTAKQLFHLYIIEGIVAYMENRFTNALHIFTDLYKRKADYPLEEWEIAELHYVLSLAALSDYRYIATIDHVLEALSFFNAHMLVKRSIECLIVLGIAQKQSGNAEDALATVKKAKEIMNNTGASESSGIIEQNLGACYSLLGDPERALLHFNESLKVKDKPLDQIATVLSIVKEYKKMEDIVLVKNWLDKGISLLDQLSDENKMLYFHHFSIYKSLLNNDINFTSIFEAALKYFESTQNYYRCFVYCNVLAEKLTEHKKFKLATTYYKKAFSYHLQYRKIQQWEELT